MSRVMMSMHTLQSIDDATVERRLRFHQRINRASMVICGVLAVDLLALYLGVMPLALRAFVRPVLVFGVTALLTLEAWREFGYDRQSSRLRWTGLTIVVCIGALAIGVALHHIWPSVEVASARDLGVAAAIEP